MNRIYLSGIVGKTSFSVTQDGKEVARLSLAVRRQGNSDITDWFNLVCFGPRVTSLIKPFISKGSKIAVSGPFQYSNYEKNGETKTSTSVIVDEIELYSTPKNENGEHTDVQPENLPDDNQLNNIGEDLPF